MATRIPIPIPTQGRKPSPSTPSAVSSPVQPLGIYIYNQTDVYIVEFKDILIRVVTQSKPEILAEIEKGPLLKAISLLPATQHLNMDIMKRVSEVMKSQKDYSLLLELVNELIRTATK